MRYKVWVFGLIAVALSGLSCEEITTQEGSGTLIVDIFVEESPFLAAGDTLVGDTVQFKVRVRDGQEQVPASNLQFTALPAGGAVEILDESTGEATFTQVGQSTVTVLVGEPDVGSAVTLQASMTVNVSEYEVELVLVSTITGADVDAVDGLLGDIVQVLATVTKGGEEVPNDGLTVTQSSDDQVANPAAPGADIVSYDGSGDATLTVTFTEPAIPGLDLLTATIDVTVKPFSVELFAETLVPGSDHLANGDTLVTDSVVFRATVVKAAADTLKKNTSDGTIWTSWSAGSIVETKNDSMGVFKATGQDTLFVVFSDLDLPGQPFKLPVEVTTYTATIDLETRVLGSDHLASGDTLLTDSVRIVPTVTRAKDGAARSSSIAYLESSDSSVVSPRDSTVVKDEAVFAATGAAILTAKLAEPLLPRDSLQDNIDLEISTYVVTAGTASSTTPIMGDTVDYPATVTDTRDGSQVASPVLDFTSSDPTVVRVLVPASAGRGLARDLGTADVTVTLVDPDLPRGTVSDTYETTTITEERFYGIPDLLAGDFGDTVTVAASEVHSFTATTEVRFSNNTSGFVISVNPTTLRFVVGAGANAGALTFINLEDDQASPRDTVQSYWSFSGGPTVDDDFEPNDVFPLPDTDKVNLTGKVPFEVILSMDPNRTAPSDTNFFWISVPAPMDLVVDITAETQQDADIDFFVCDGIGDPPTSYDDAACARDKSLNGSGRVEEQLDEVLSPRRHVFGFYCVGGCDVVPVTYKVWIRESS